eukprot:4368618-Amphidinium_carterae.1
MQSATLVYNNGVDLLQCYSLTAHHGHWGGLRLSKFSTCSACRRILAAPPCTSRPFMSALVGKPRASATKAAT